MAPVPLDQASVSMRQKLMALIALSSTGTLVGLFSKVSQVSGRYEFSPASAVVCTEFFKLCISVTIIIRLLMKRELVDRSKTTAPSAKQPLMNGSTGNTALTKKKGTEEDGEKESAMVVVVADENNDIAHLKSESQLDDEDAAPPTTTYTLTDDWRDFWSTNATLPVICHEAGLAAAYSIVNVVTYAIFIHASGSMFFLLKASSPVVTAVLLWLMVNRRISRPQWIAVILQCFGLFGTQLNPCGSAAAVSLTGYILILVNVVVSCAAGVWNEHIIKNYGTSVNAQNTILYTFGVVINLMLFWFAPPEWTGLSSEKQLSFFQGYNGAVVAVIMANGSVGLVITMVYKYADVVVKTFGLAGSTMTLYMLEMSGLIPGGRSMPLSTTLTGAAAVFFASYIYIVPGAEFAPQNHPSNQQVSNNNNDTTNNSDKEGTNGNGNRNGSSLTSSSAVVSSSAAPFDVMTLSWSGALGNRKIRLLIGIGMLVVMSFLAAKLACNFGM